MQTDVLKTQNQNLNMKIKYQNHWRCHFSSTSKWKKPKSFLVTTRFIVQKTSRSSQVFHKKAVVKNFAEFTRRYLCRSFFYSEEINKWLRHRCFLVNFVKSLKTPLLRKTSGWLLLKTWALSLVFPFIL